MALTTGTKLGVYEIVGAIGAGGMGEVYRARDTKLRRDVAIKVLPDSFADDRDRLDRFEREARLLASLNHPHIAAIYGLEESNGTRALVLELVEGETLDERLLRPVPVGEALSIAGEIAEALEAAHERGIVHRDLKPANVKIARDGRVKVLDFGIAKVVGDSGAVDVTHERTLDRTTEGIVIGTAGYMSPEQARGGDIDKRTDIWAFGCVLFEMLAGRLAFPGDTVSDRIAAVLQREPQWDELPEQTPAAVRRLLRRCLEKDPKDRLRDIGDARIELDEARDEEPQARAAAAPALMSRRSAITALAGAAAGAAGVGVFTATRQHTPPSHGVTRFSIAMPEGEYHQISFNDRVSFSPDGSRLAFNTVGATGAGAPSLYLHTLRDLKPKRLDIGSAAAPFFSPDGGWLGFLLLKPSVALRKIALGGGSPVTLCPLIAFYGATWARDGTIYFVGDTPGGILSVPAAGGPPKEFLKIDTAAGERVMKFPSALPSGDAFLLTVATADSESFDDAQIVGVSTRTRQKKVLVERGTHPRYSPSGHLVYARDGKLLAVRFDPDRLEVSGQPVAVADGVLMSRNSGVAFFDLSANGDLTYIPGIAEGGARTLVWVDRSGKAEPLPLPPRSYLHPRISPDARRLAIEIEGANHDLYVYDFASGVLSNLTNDGVSHWPVWSPDGSEIGYRAGGMGHFRLWQMAADRSHGPQQIPASGFSQSFDSYSPDGRAVAYTNVDPGAPPRVDVVNLGNPVARPLDSTKYAQGSAKFSPDGRWLAYCSNESGQPQVYAKAYPGPGAKIQVSNDGGTDPVWRRDGAELFYRHGDDMMNVPVSLASGFNAGRPQKLWSGHYSPGMSSSCGAPGPTSSNYDVTPDGQRFLMIKDNDQDLTISRQIIVVLGWADELKRV